ncbi:MAG: hydroxysqualene dehydroxylase HpnE [Bacteroidota bacterium]
MSGGTIVRDSAPDAVIIGGGMAGLSAAVDLVRRGHTVVLVEQKQHLGGRTYSFVHPETGDDIDNGQHLMMGCYHSTLRYLQTIGMMDAVEIQKHLTILFRRKGKPSGLLKSGRLPAPFHILSGLLHLTILPLSHRLRLLRVGVELLVRNPDTDRHLQSITVDRWLDEMKQPPENKEYLWNIIAIGALNDSPAVISAAMFVKVLKSAFFGARQNSSMVIPKRGLSSVLIDAAESYIRSQGSRIVLNSAVKNIDIEDSTVQSVIMESGEVFIPSTVISAVPYFDFPRLFPGAASSVIKNIDAFVSSPIITIHLWFDAHFVEEKFAALIGSRIHWVFNKTEIYGKKGEGLMYLSLVVSGAHDLIGKSKEDLVAIAHDELKQFYPAASLAAIVHSLVIKEKRATFSPSVEIESQRPAARTAVNNLFIAGDWTDTKLPATIEGAVQSGYESAALAAIEIEQKKYPK